MRLYVLPSRCLYLDLYLRLDLCFTCGDDALGFDAGVVQLEALDQLASRRKLVPASYGLYGWQLNGCR